MTPPLSLPLPPLHAGRQKKKHTGSSSVSLLRLMMVGTSTWRCQVPTLRRRACPSRSPPTEHESKVRQKKKKKTQQNAGECVGRRARAKHRSVQDRHTRQAAATTTRAENSNKEHQHRRRRRRQRQRRPTPARTNSIISGANDSFCHGSRGHYYPSTFLRTGKAGRRNETSLPKRSRPPHQPSTNHNHGQKTTPREAHKPERGTR